MTREVVITGCGIVTANGIGRAAFAEALRSGRTGIGDLTAFDASDTGHERAAEIASFDPAPYLRTPKNYLDRNSALAFAAAEMAVRESGLALPQMNRAFGVACGSMAGNVESLGAFCAKVVEKGPKLAPPFLFPHTYYNTTAGLLSIEYGLNGPHGQFCSGGAAGLEAVLFAAECIARGRTEAMLAGGAEAFNERTFRVAAGRGWLSPGGAESCRPFGTGRNGTILGEGAAFFVLEAAESARARGAKVLARIGAFAVAGSAAEVYATTLASAFDDEDDDEKRTRTTIAHPAVVMASAGGYPRLDSEEAAAIAKAMGGRECLVAAVKALAGETLGASGPVALAAALSAMEGGFVPATPICDCEFPEVKVADKARKAEVRAALVSAGGPWDGNWCAVVVRR